jgi:hypothetical protein
MFMVSKIANENFCDKLMEKFLGIFREGEQSIGLTT